MVRSRPVLLIVLAGVACSRGSLQRDAGGAGTLAFDAASLDGGLPRADVPLLNVDAAHPVADAFPPFDAPAPSADANCGTTSVSAAPRIDPELLVVLDRSVPGDAPAWNGFLSSIAATITTNDPTIDWGLYSFPADGPACGAGTVSAAIDTPPARHNAMHVIEHIAGAGSTASGTPTAAAIETAAAYMRGRQNPNPKYLVLLTDGPPSCAGSADALSADPTQAQADAVAAIAASRSGGVPTIVVAPSTTTATADIVALNALAHAGGYQPSPDAPGSIAFNTELTFPFLFAPVETAQSCVVSLTTTPPVPDVVTVTFNGVVVPRDTARASGWDYTDSNHRSVMLYGEWCDMLLNDAPYRIDIYYGCGNPG